MQFKIITLFLIVSFFWIEGINAQNAVGIGTESPNSNAVLHLVSPTNNQGLLVPRLTTAQRTAESFTSRLSNNENGLMVFDTNLSTFFYWVSNRWEKVSGVLLTGGEGVTIDEDGVISIDLPEPQNLTLTNNQLRITNNENATVIDLTPYLNVQNASQVPVTPTAALLATNVQAALVELQTEILNPAGNMLKATYDPTNINGSAFDLTNHIGNLPATRITGLGTAAALNVGVNSGNIVQLDGIGLPPIDGSRLTGLSLTQFPGLGALATLNTVSSTEIVNNTIVNEDISNAAQIAGTKVTPNFGTQNLVTTGTMTAGAFVGDGSGLTSVGPWTLTSGNINRATGNVGIGVATPSVKLDIAGNLKLLNGSQGINRVLVSDANGLSTWQLIGTNSITDNSILNVDISNTAAIEGTKVVPNFGSQSINTSGSITGSSFIGDGSGLTGVTGATVDDGSITGGIGTGVKIAVNTITNDNISTTAAILGSKITPNFGAQNISTTGSITGGNFTGDGSGLINVGPWTTSGANINRASGNVGIGNASPTAKLDILGTIKIVDGTEGVGKYLVSDADGLASWQSASAGGWVLSGNAGTVDGTNFIGTTDSQPLNFSVNNQRSGRIDENGNTFFGYSAGLVNTATDNTFIGSDAGLDVSTGQNNVFVGSGAGASTTVGIENTFIGTFSGFNNIDGQYNTFVGYSSGADNVDGQDNTFLGFLAGNKNDFGSGNTFLGSQAGEFNTDGENNTFVGYLSGYNNDTGVDNAFYGLEAGRENTNGQGNSFFGARAGFNNTLANSNSFFGESAGYANTTGQFNSFFGSNVGRTNTTGSDNAFFGSNAGYSNSTAFWNSFFGANAGYSNTSGQNNAFFGSEAGFSNLTASGNSFFGKNAGRANTIGFQNSFFGNRAGDGNIDGDNNSFFGNFSGFSNTTGNSNSYFGANSGEGNTSGINNTSIGYLAGNLNTTGSTNTIVGALAGQNNTVSGNSFFGYSAGRNNTNASGNSYFGEFSGSSNTTGADNAFFGTATGVNNTANQNSFFGASTGEANTSGQQNSFFGTSSGRNNTTGGNNVAFGFRTLSTNLTGSRLTVIGQDADVLSDGLTNATAIGYNAKVGASNSIVLGGTGVDAVNVGIGISTPNHLFQMNSATTTATLQITNSATGSDLLDGTWMQVNSSGSFSINNRHNAGITFGTNTTTKMTINATGDVGIGTVTPAEKLDVVGTVTATNFTYKAPVQNIYAISPVDFQVLKTLFTDDYTMLFGTNGISARVGSANAGTTVNMAAPLHLPDGAVITRIDVLGSNISTVTGTDIILMEKSYSTASTQIPITTIPANTAAITTFSNTTLNYTINNDNDNFYIYVRALTNQTSITGIKVFYTVAKPD